ncbi:GIY-YIG nuclease family protein [Nakamurella sp. YIM 132087]|uniref:GIY-YIG nuclease family protein n=1 Tax=Nakamurella alba TaxID=2665158 RepID=A0A7K1FKX2_9ACTN|nr:GIY-YIG nuclease family protein [Nakamurella alba]MTD13524.1 GIY-YIG nuclease family protein [Nakamurella alba]
MTLTFGSMLQSADIDPAAALVLRHAHVQSHDDGGLPGLHADSTPAEILAYTAEQASDPRLFPAQPPPLWIVFVREGGDRARLWSVLENRGEITNDGKLRTFDLVESDRLSDLRDRLVIGWPSPRNWRINAGTAATYPVLEIADAAPPRFPGFDSLVLDHARLRAVMREHRYAAWRTALESVIGIYLITDTSDGRQYVGKADGLDSIRQRWSEYATNGHGGNVELRGLDPSHFRFSLLRVFDPSSPRRVIDEAESHFKNALDTRRHGLNRN